MIRRLRHAKRRRTLHKCAVAVRSASTGRAHGCQTSVPALADSGNTTTSTRRLSAPPRPIGVSQGVYAFTPPQCFSSTFARENIVSSSMPVIPAKLLEEAAGAVASDAHSKHGNRVSLFDASDKRCLLCNVSTVDVGLNAHTAHFIHQARLGIVERAIALINWHLQLVSSPLQQPSNGKETEGSAASRGGSGPSMRADRARGACAGGPGRSFLFLEGVGGLPSLSSAPHSSPQQRLKEVNWTAVLVEHWWRAIDIQARALPLPGVAMGTPGLRTQGYDDINTRTCDFGRIPSLSSKYALQRKWRMRYLLRFLTQRGVLRDSLQLSEQRTASLLSGTFTRTPRFERCEMMGDSVLKNVLRDRLVRVFPVHEGGMNGRLAILQQVIDSNPGLLAIYDYLQLDSIVGAKLPNTKAKADVVEALFGELHTILLASETMTGVEHYPAFLDRERGYVRAVVEHVLHELAHLVIMWRLEETLANAREFVEANTVELWLARGARGGGRRGQDRSAGAHATVNEESIDRGPYDTLPLLTELSRSPRQQFSSSQEAWYHSRFVATTRASPDNELQRTVSACALSPLTGQRIRSHYEFGALRVTAASAGKRQCTPSDPSSLAGEAADGGSKEGNPSPGATRYPRWKAEEMRRLRLRGSEQHETSTPLLCRNALDRVLRRELDRFAGCERPLRRGTTTAHPDLTKKPQQPLYTTHQGQRLLMRFTLQ